ncbi:MAG TPA: hypothetical protein VGL27_18300 [Negativicutes bacterium]|jgi:hypothetical protein
MITLYEYHIRQFKELCQKEQMAVGMLGGKFKDQNRMVKNIYPIAAGDSEQESLVKAQMEQKNETCIGWFYSFDGLGIKDSLINETKLKELTYYVVAVFLPEYDPVLRAYCVNNEVIQEESILLKKLD